MRLFIVALTFIVAGCSSLGSEYFLARDRAVVDVLENCRSQEVTILKESSTVKDLAVSFVEVKGKLIKCQSVTDEVINLLVKE